MDRSRKSGQVSKNIGKNPTRAGFSEKKYLRFQKATVWLFLVASLGGVIVADYQPNASLAAAWVIIFCILILNSQEHNSIKISYDRK